jgi:hypothetical protein
MAWEIVAVWIIIAAAVILFVRDERRGRARDLDAMARHFATAAQWRHRSGRQMDLLIEHTPTAGLATVPDGARAARARKLFKESLAQG